MLVTGVVTSITQVALVSLEALPAASTCRTWNVCEPSPRPVYEVGWCRPRSSSSREQAKVPPGSPLNVKPADVEGLQAAGPESMLGAFGKVVSDPGEAVGAEVACVVGDADDKGVGAVPEARQAHGAGARCEALLSRAYSASPVSVLVQATAPSEALLGLRLAMIATVGATVDRPAVADAVGVAGAVDGDDEERMTAVDEARVGRRAGACRDGARVEPAGERCRLVGAEGERRVGARAGGCRHGVEGHRRAVASTLQLKLYEVVLPASSPTIRSKVWAPSPSPGKETGRCRPNAAPSSGR